MAESNDLEDDHSRTTPGSAVASHEIANRLLTSKCPSRLILTRPCPYWNGRSVSRMCETVMRLSVGESIFTSVDLFHPGPENVIPTVLLRHPFTTNEHSTASSNVEKSSVMSIRSSPCRLLWKTGPYTIGSGA